MDYDVKPGMRPDFLSQTMEAKRAREEDTLDGSKGDQVLGKSRALFRDPMQGPLSLVLDTSKR